jgi:hypothetical protein
MANDENVAMRFVEDADGNAIGGRRAQDIQRRIRGIFGHLADQPSGPASTWTGNSGMKQQYFYQELGKLFPELRLCELDWKADKLAIDAYPSWYATYTKHEDERIAQMKIKAEAHDDVVSATISDKRSRSPSLPSTQRKKKAKYSAPSRITTATTATVPSAPSITSSFSTVPESSSLSACTSLPSTATTSTLPTASQLTTSITVDVHSLTTAITGDSTQDHQDSEPETIIMPDVNVVRGKGKERARDSDIDSAAKSPLVKVRPQ